MRPHRSEPSNQPDATLAGLAGDDYLGDGLGVNCSLTVDVQEDSSFTWAGCMGVYDRNAGSIRIEAGHLILSPWGPNRRDGFRGMATDLRIVPLGRAAIAGCDVDLASASGTIFVKIVFAPASPTI